MAVLVDEARWPAHGRQWAHLVSDVSYEELHAFAAATGLPPRGFDRDHYDVPGDRIDALVAAGAQRVGGRELLRRLVASGLRVPGRERRGAPAHPPARGVVGIVLSAGTGARSGAARASLLDDDGVPRLHRCVGALRAGGCAQVLVVLGAGADRARVLVPPGASTVLVDDGSGGASASLRAGLEAAARLEAAPAAALVLPLESDGPKVEEIIRLARLVDRTPGPSGVDVLARASRSGAPAHPVLLGRAHWAAASASATGDRLAGAYLRESGAILVELEDRGHGVEADRGHAAPGPGAVSAPRPTLGA